MKMFRRCLWAAPLLLAGGCAPSNVASGAPLPAAPVKPMTVPASRDKNTFDFARASALAHNSSALVRAQNRFSARLVERLESQNQKHQNLLVSPTSLWQALSLAQLGARGQTKSELQRLLSLESLPDAQLGAENRAWNDLLCEQKGASILVANSAWFADEFRPDVTFVQSAKHDFGAGIEKFSSADPGGAASRINDWVSRRTRKEISQIVGEADVAGQSALLVNAVYFRGAWQNPFDKSQTKPAPFHLQSGPSVQVPMMNRTLQHAFLNGQTFEGARLGYQNTNCALWVLLPAKGKTPTDVLRELGEPSAKQPGATGPIELRLPRFDIKWSDRLNTDLIALGARTPFGSQADFSAMGAPTQGISAVIHLCKMRVDEEGTVAAAATAVAMAGAAMAPPQKPRQLVFDRPFVVALVEETSGARLFESIVFDPTK